MWYLDVQDKERGSDAGHHPLEVTFSRPKIDEPCRISHECLLCDVAYHLKNNKLAGEGEAIARIRTM